MKTRTIKVDYLARVEGEGALHIVMADGLVKDVQLKIFEPPRFFEALLRGRPAKETPDITARICGICPVAYQMSSVHALEQIVGITMPESLRRLRRLLYCGEWIESHGLHIYMLHAPDFLGYHDAVAMAKDHGDDVRRGLRLKKAGNSIVSVIGGREVHPINVKVGGFYRLPTKEEISVLIEPLTKAREDALATVKWISTFNFPKLEREYLFVSMQHESEYPFNEGVVTNSQGLAITANQFEDHYKEEHVGYSNALHCALNGQAYLCGPMARYNLNREKLPNSCKKAAIECGLEDYCNNPFKSILIRAIEVLFAVEEELEIVSSYERPSEPSLPFTWKAGTGYAVTEAPRGILYHRYDIDDNGVITEAKIIAPTGQNQKSIEADLRELVKENISLEDDPLRHLCEQGIRNYDPCISCATHFLNMTFDGR